MFSQLKSTEGTLAIVFDSIVVEESTDGWSELRAVFSFKPLRDTAASWCLLSAVNSDESVNVSREPSTLSQPSDYDSTLARFSHQKAQMRPVIEGFES